MRVIVLVENTSISKDYKSKHGLCLYIETKKHKLLFDLGSNSLFLKNIAMTIIAMAIFPGKTQPE